MQIVNNVSNNSAINFGHKFTIKEGLISSFVSKLDYDTRRTSEINEQIPKLASEIIDSFTKKTEGNGTINIENLELVEAGHQVGLKISALFEGKKISSTYIDEKDRLNSMKAAIAFPRNLYGALENFRLNIK